MIIVNVFVLNKILFPNLEAFYNVILNYFLRIKNFNRQLI